MDQCVMSSPAIADGIVFIGADDGRVYAFGENPAVTTNIRIEGKYGTIWSGEVTFNNSTIVDTDTVSHYLVKPTALGAVDAASKLDNFSYEVENQPNGLFLRSIDGEAYDPETSDGWLYRIDYYSPVVEAADFIVGATEPPSAPHREILWYYGSSAIDPLNITLDKTTVAAGESFNATVHYYNDTSSGWEPLADATVLIGPLNFTTSSNGNATISVSSAGTHLVYAEKEGFVRSTKKDVNVFSPQINVRIEGKNATIWYGAVTVHNSTIVDTEGVSHCLDKPTALGALDAASKLGNFAYEVENQIWGLFLKSIDGEINDPVTWDGWMYRVDYYSPLVGAVDFVINVTEPPSTPHKEVLWYYGSWNAAPLRITLDKTTANVNEHVTATVESYNHTSDLWNLVNNATVYGTSSNYTTDINGSAIIALPAAGTYMLYAEKEGYIRSAKKSVTVTSVGGGDGGSGGVDTTYWWSGSVTLPSGTFTTSAFDTSKQYTINWQTALGALQKASEIRPFTYTIEDTSLGPMIYAIAGKEKYSEGGTSGWMYQVNGKTPMVGAHDCSVISGDEIIWYFSTSINTTPSTSSMALKINIVNAGEGSSGSSSSISPDSTLTSVPTQTVQEIKTIDVIEAGANASVTFERTNVTGMIIHANTTIRNAEVMIQLTENPGGITTVSGISYCCFNITTTNVTDTNITRATITFKVNRTWIIENNIDEASITLYRYHDNQWTALPTAKIGEDNTSVYFEAETPGFSLFAVAGEKRSTRTSTPEAPVAPLPLTTSDNNSTPAMAARSTPVPAPASASTTSVLHPEMWIIMPIVGGALLVIILAAYIKSRSGKE